METPITELETILEEELVLHKRLLAVAVAMNVALKRESIDDVRKANKEYDELTISIESIEEKRLSKSDDIARHYRLQQHVNLLRIIEVIPPTNKKRMHELRVSLRAVIAELQKINTSNRILLTEALFAITKTFEFIATASEKISGYKQQGKKNISKIKRTIINTVI
jgi:flagellar biosynthesis/type III secretory pathway chaperone